MKERFVDGKDPDIGNFCNFLNLKIEHVKIILWKFF